MIDTKQTPCLFLRSLILLPPQGVTTLQNLESTLSTQVSQQAIHPEVPYLWVCMLLTLYKSCPVCKLPHLECCVPRVVGARLTVTRSSVPFALNEDIGLNLALLLIGCDKHPAHISLCTGARVSL